MVDRFVGAFVEKLVLLEQRIGSKVQYRVMPPLTSPFHDRLSVQSVAKRIAEFIGLGDFTFIVAVIKQEEHVGGHIDLSTSGRAVFVEVDSDMLKFPDAVAATLCHEVCHKYLQVNGICAPLEIENEILTDVTSVFLGFGKIMLNGCRATYIKHEAVGSGTRTTTETMTAGYLDRNQLAFVYRIVCAMRSIPSSDFMKGLNADAATAVRRCDSAYGEHYDSSFHRMEATHELVSGFNSRVTEVQRSMAGLNKHVTYIKKSLCDTIDTFVIDGHRRLESLRQKTVAMAQDDDPDPALRFLRAVQSDFEV